MDLFPIRLRTIRKMRRFTQELLADKINVTKVSISGYENGNRTPDLSTLNKLANALNCSVDYLLGRSNTPELTVDQENLINDLHLPIEEILEKYTLLWEGEEVSKEEIIEMLTYLKAKRIMSDIKK